MAFLSSFGRSFVSKIAVGVSAVAGAAVYASGQGTSAEGACSKALRQANRNFLPGNDFPDLSKHNNCLANHLTPTLYNKLRDLVSLCDIFLLNFNVMFQYFSRIYFSHQMTTDTTILRNLLMKLYALEVFHRSLYHIVD